MNSTDILRKANDLRVHKKFKVCDIDFIMIVPLSLNDLLLAWDRKAVKRCIEAKCATSFEYKM